MTEVIRAVGLRKHYRGVAALDGLDLAIPQGSIYGLVALGPLRRELQRWLGKARRTGLDDESIEALFLNTFRSGTEEREDIA